MWGVFATGDLFELGGRTVGAAIGAEFREDSIASQNDIVGVLALNAAENPLQEGETIGSRDLVEVYGEVNIPLLDTLDVDAALRYTDESNFGTETTYRLRGAWTPIDALSFSATFGTSFRAPNLREQFLADQFGGVGGNLDPCIAANINTLVNDSGDSDPQTQLVIGNCINEGIIFTDTDNNGFPDSTVHGSTGVTTIPIATGGNVNLVAETSETQTFTVKFTQPWSDAFDLDVALSYFDIVIEDTVAEPEADIILQGCYADPQFPVGTSPFCALHTRIGDTSPVGPQSNFVNFVDVSFVNIGEETARGIDLNTRLNFELFDSFDISWSTVTTRLLEREIEVFDPSDRDDNVGEIGFNETKFTSTLGVFIGDWEFLMQNRFLSGTQQDDPDAMPTGGGGRFSADGNNSRDLDFTDDIWYTDLSATYGTDTWSATLGVRNLFDEDPPLIHSFEGPNRNNAVSAAGYDFYGQTVYLNATVSF
jgi:iron complex outermembrane receptor protein